MLDVIYDGRCGFCVRALGICRACDLRGKLRFHDAHDRPALASRFPELAGAELNDAMYAVDGERRVHRGFFGFRQIVRRCPLLWPLLPMLHCPGAHRLGPALYAVMARHRHRLGCESEVCAWPVDRS